MLDPGLSMLVRRIDKMEEDVKKLALGLRSRSGESETVCLTEALLFSKLDRKMIRVKKARDVLYNVPIRYDNTNLARCFWLLLVAYHRVPK